MAKKHKKKDATSFKVVLLIILILLLAALIWVAVVLGWNEAPELSAGLKPGQQETQNVAEETIVVPADQEVDVVLQETVPVDRNLQIEGMANYAGVYMEDGSDEVVTDVMMIILKNTGDQDVQLARIDVVYEGLVAEFEVSNLPAGEMLVALEKNRKAMPAGTYQRVELKNVAYFAEPMTVMADKLEITGGNGYIDVKNITEEDIAGPTRVFYKNSATDLLYGGITYMATLQEGVSAGETVRVLTGHYSEGNSRVVNVTCGG